MREELNFVWFDDATYKYKPPLKWDPPRAGLWPSIYDAGHVHLLCLQYKEPAPDFTQEEIDMYITLCEARYARR